MFAYCNNNPIGKADSEGGRPYNVNMTDSGPLSGQARALIRYWEEKYYLEREEKLGNYVDKPVIEFTTPSISHNGIQFGVIASASKTHISDGALRLDANMLTAEACTEISYDHWKASAGVYLAEMVYTFKLFKNVSISLGGNAGIGAHFESTATSITVGTTCGIGLKISVNWGVVSEGVSAESENYERKVD